MDCFSSLQLPQRKTGPFALLGEKMNINDILERIKKIFKKEKRNLLTDGQHLNIKRDNSKKLFFWE